MEELIEFYFLLLPSRSFALLTPVWINVCLCDGTIILWGHTTTVIKTIITVIGCSSWLILNERPTWNF